MNHRNPAIKRILADVKELQKHPSSRYHAVPLEDNMFEWHFTIRGPEETEFAGGIYHGRILLPAEYPFKPPNIVFLTVCLFNTLCRSFPYLSFLFLIVRKMVDLKSEQKFA
jgi:ubiquitin-protein ligase